jgi:hypothetical protein
MMNPEEIINEVHKLPLPQQKKIYDALSKELAQLSPPDEEDDPDQRLQRRLYAKGMISEIKPRRTGKIADFTPIKIKGKPLSETIIEERR